MGPDYVWEDVPDCGLLLHGWVEDADFFADEPEISFFIRTFVAECCGQEI